MTLEELKEIVSKYMLLADTSIVKMLAQTVIANRLPTPPVWLFLVSNSSGGKSELLRALTGCDGVFLQDDLTANSFISGQKGQNGQEMGLLANMPQNNPIMLISDFTIFLQKNSEANEMIMSQFRLIYDGSYSKKHGNKVESSKWNGKMGLIAGVTPVVYTHNSKYSAMGERFVMYFMDQPDRKAVTKMGIQATNDNKKKEELQKAFREYIEGIPLPPSEKEIPEIDSTTLSALVDLSELATRARSGVERSETGYKREIIAKPSAEMPVRLGKQLSNLARAAIVMNPDHKIHSEDQQALYKIALDSIAPQRRMIMNELTKRAIMNTGALASELKMPVPSIEIPLEDLNALGVVERTKSFGGGGGYNWELKYEYRELLSKFEHIKMTNETLVMDEDEVTKGIPSMVEQPAPTTKPADQSLLDIFPGSEEVIEP